MDTYVNGVILSKRDHFSKYDPKRSNHANFQLLKIKNKKVMNKKPLIFENTNPLDSEDDITVAEKNDSGRNNKREIFSFFLSGPISELISAKH